ncbi:hypothetical protein FS749_013449, partial [Ceratobasidium sp. UAMH 11750]
AKLAASIQAQLSSSLSAALLDSSSATYRTPYIARPDSPDRSPSNAGARHSPFATRQHTYPFHTSFALASRPGCLRRVESIEAIEARSLSLAHFRRSFARLVSARTHSVALFDRGTTRQG